MVSDSAATGFVLITPFTTAPKPTEFWAWAVHVIWELCLKPQMLPFPPAAALDITVTVEGLDRDPSLHSN